MIDSLPRTAAEQLAYWLEQGADKFVYVIKAKDESPIKVGKAESVTARLAQLQTGNHRQLVLKRVLVGYSGLERQLHRKLRRHRIRGEWFDGEPIREFMRYTEDLAEQMLLSHRETGHLPDWREFGEWENPSKKREIAPVITKRVEPEKWIGRKKQREDIGWMRLCPACHTSRFTIVSESKQPAQFDPFEAGLLRCSFGHLWSYATSQGFDPKRQEGRFYIISQA